MVRVWGFEFEPGESLEDSPEESPEEILVRYQPIPSKETPSCSSKGRRQFDRFPGKILFPQGCVGRGCDEFPSGYECGVSLFRCVLCLAGGLLALS